jgi:hypothetical protein
MNNNFDAFEKAELHGMIAKRQFDCEQNMKMLQQSGSNNKNQILEYKKKIQKLDILLDKIFNTGE